MSSPVPGPQAPPSFGATQPGETLFPTFLRLRGRKVLLVGGGVVATAKYASLQASGAAITIVAPAICADLRTAAAGSVFVERAFEPSDLDGAWFVVAAAPAFVNQQVAQAAAPRHIFVNAVDDLDAASAFAGGVIRRGSVTVAISTAGAAPALAGLLREGLEAVLPDDMEAWCQVARELRPVWRRQSVPMRDRRPHLLRALNGLYASPNDPTDPGNQQGNP